MDLPLVVDVLEWVALAALALVAWTAVRHVRGNAALAILHDLQPYLLAAAWPVLVLALLERAWWLAVAAGALACRHAVLVVPRLVSDHLPAWARGAPSARMAVSNVYVDNATPEHLAAELVHTRADVIVIVEWNPTFAAAFADTPGAAAYAQRVEDPDDRSDYAVCVLSRLPLDPGSRMVELGALRAAHAVVRTAAGPLHVLALNPKATVDKGGYDTWHEQMTTLIERVPALPRPFVLAGDLNSTQFRPAFKALLRAGTTDAHDSLGKGLTRSFRLAAHGLLARLGDVVRLDHALLGPGVRAIAAHDLPPCGSDHRPFVVSLVIGPDESGAAHPAPGSAGSAADVAH